jgi:hypothetical protein
MEEQVMVTVEELAAPDGATVMLKLDGGDAEALLFLARFNVSIPELFEKTPGGDIPGRVATVLSRITAALHGRIDDLAWAKKGDIRRESQDNL